jgi:hypothetical protein
MTPIPMTRNASGCCGPRRRARCRRSSGTSSTDRRRRDREHQGQRSHRHCRGLARGASRRRSAAGRGLPRAVDRHRMSRASRMTGRHCPSRCWPSGLARTVPSRRACARLMPRRLGVAATALDRANGFVRLADGSEVEGDRLLIATGVRSRKWPNPEEAALEGVYTLRTSADAAAGRAGRPAAASADHRVRVHRFGGGLGLPRPRPRRHRR